MNYRPDIDGLRALAIAPVVLYHAYGPFLPGGFVGVDIFFVISGYLISLLVKKEIESSTFSLAKFYERRARRILPALIVMMSVVLAFGLVSLPPAHLAELSSSTASAALFFSNIHFWTSIGYFSTDAEFWPLLHTWSLSVEEQFYLFHPLFIFFLLRFLSRPSGHISLLLAVIFSSLALCIYATGKYPSASFYLLPFRYWELALGALGAFVAGRAAYRSALNESLALLGLIAIVSGITLYDDTIPFPGAWALLPVIGTFLVIVCGPSTLVSRCLAWRPLVLIGLISYSLYLWHWPILAFARYAFGSPELPLSIATWCVLVAIIISTLSWRFVERPFRRLNFLGRAQVFRIGLGTTLALSLGGWLLVGSSGFPQRLNPEEAALAASINDYRSSDHCWGRNPAKDPCFVGNTSRDPELLLWGDSHAGALLPAFEQSLLKLGSSGVVATRGACAPLLSVSRVGYDDAACNQFNRQVTQWLRDDKHTVDKVVLVARWNLNATGVRPPGEAGAPVRLIYSKASRVNMTQVEVFEAGLNETIRFLRGLGLKVVLLDDTPEIGWNVPMATFFRTRLGLKQLEGPDSEQVRVRSAEAHAVMRRVAARNGAEFVSINEDLCKPRCQLYYKGNPMYSDDDHVSTLGAKQVIAPLLLKHDVLQ